MMLGAKHLYCKFYLYFVFNDKHVSNKLYQKDRKFLGGHFLNVEEIPSMPTKRESCEMIVKKKNLVIIKNNGNTFKQTKKHKN